jgi:hypothetical protein
VWSYLFYLYYISHKVKTEFNGIDTYISGKIENNDLSWVPFGRALSISKEDSVSVNESVDKKVKKTIVCIKNVIKTNEKYLNN